MSLCGLWHFLTLCCKEYSFNDCWSLSIPNTCLYLTRRPLKPTERKHQADHYWLHQTSHGRDVPSIQCPLNVSPSWPASCCPPVRQFCKRWQCTLQWRFDCLSHWRHHWHRRRSRNHPSELTPTGLAPDCAHLQLPRQRNGHSSLSWPNPTHCFVWRRAVEDSTFCCSDHLVRLSVTSVQVLQIWLIK